MKKFLFLSRSDDDLIIRVDTIKKIIVQHLDSRSFNLIIHSGTDEPENITVSKDILDNIYKDFFPEIEWFYIDETEMPQLKKPKGM